jgi:ribose transport system substrate-binding protein
MRKSLMVLLAMLLASAVPHRTFAQDKAVAMSFGDSTTELWNDIIKLMRPALKKEGFELIVDDPQFRVEQQVQDWKAWIAQGRVAAIMGWPINADALTPVTRQARDAGIPVLGYAATWSGVSASVLTTPESDGRDFAKYAVEWIKQKYGNKDVKVAVLTDEQNDLTRYRVEGIVKELTEGAPNVMIYKLPCFTREDGFNAAKQQMTAHADTRVWLSYGNENLKGAYKAMVNSGVAKDDPEFFLAGMDATNEDLDLIKKANSIYRMAFAFRSEALANASTALLTAAANRQPLKDIYIRPELVTSETADSFYVGR